MLVETTFIFIALLLFFGFFGEVLFRKTKIPDVLWLIVAGILLSVFGIVDISSFDSVAPYFTAFVLLYLLFESGINTDIREFLKTAPRGLMLSVLSFIFTMGVITLIAWLLGFSLVLSLLLGSILGGISSAVVIPALKGMDLKESTKLSLIFDSSFSDVLCILVTVTIIDVVTLGGLTSSISGFDITKEILSSFLIAIAIGLVCAFAWNNMLQRRIHDHILTLTLGFMLLVYSFTQVLGANGAIACLVFGLILGNTKKIERIIQAEEEVVGTKRKSKDVKKAQAPSAMQHVVTKHSKEVYAELAFVVKVLFFVYFGLFLDFSSYVVFLYGGLFFLGILLLRPLAVYLSFPKTTTRFDANILATLIPKGLAPAVLVQLPVQAGIPGAEGIVGLVLATVLISIVFGMLFTVLIQKNPSFRGILPFLFSKFQK